MVDGGIGTTEWKIKSLHNDALTLCNTFIKEKEEA